MLYFYINIIFIVHYIIMAHNIRFIFIFFYSQITVYNAFSELLDTQNFWPLRANHGGPEGDTKLSETPSYQSLNVGMSVPCYKHFYAYNNLV